jgi:hypothetical protein
MQAALMASDQETKNRQADQEGFQRQSQQASSDALVSSLATIVDRLSTAATAPKRIVRDPNGKAIGVESVSDSSPVASPSPKPKKKGS